MFYHIEYICIYIYTNLFFFDTAFLLGGNRGQSIEDLQWGRGVVFTDIYIYTHIIYLYIYIYLLCN